MKNTPTIIDIEEIKKILHHRYPFLLIDRIIEVKKGEYIKAIKNVTYNEQFFQGHFPTEIIQAAITDPPLSWNFQAFLRFDY